MRIRYDMIGTTDNRNPVIVIQDLGIKYERAEPFPIGDCWLFRGVDKATLPEVIPSYIEILYDL